MQLGFTFCIMSNLEKYIRFTPPLAEHRTVVLLVHAGQRYTTYHHFKGSWLGKSQWGAHFGSTVTAKENGPSGDTPRGTCNSFLAVK